MHNNNMQNNQRNLTSAEREMLRNIAKIAPNFPVISRYERKKRFGTHRSVNPTTLDNLRSIMERKELNFVFDEVFTPGTRCSFEDFVATSRKYR